MPEPTYDLGFLGGGQLARMSIQAAQRMGLRCISLDPGDDTPASQIAAARVGRLDDPDAIAEIFRLANRVTLENEFIPAEAIETAMRTTGTDPSRLRPGTRTLGTIQDKLTQRQALAQAGVPSPPAVEVTGEAESAVATLGFPFVLKSRFGGYDGKGTRYARTEADLAATRELWSGGGWLAEAFVPFRRELAVMVCRSETQTVCFPTMETVQENHVCSLVYPAGVDASAVAIAAVEAVDGLGLYGVELFELEDGTIQVNEIAPRPHNTGHYTLDWGGMSQFEAHVRLVMGLPIPELEGGETCMANLLGQPGAGDFREALRAAVEADPGVRVHWYGKVDSKPGRKMGHLNVVGNEAVARASAARERFYAAWTR